MSAVQEPKARARKGRGTALNPSGRFERFARVEIDDGWGGFGNGDPDFPPPPGWDTMVQPEILRTIISENDSPDLSFDRSVNPYRGCEHGCVYCYARPNHAYAGLSPGLDFETRIFSRPNAAALLAQALDKPGYQPKTLMLSGVTDCYQPAEKTLEITRSLLKVLWERRHPAAVVTKSALILRDLDLIGPMAEAGLFKAAISVTTLNPRLARLMEPRAAAPHRRLETIKILADAGVPTSVLAAPMIPGLNDSELEAILTQAARNGARDAGYILLRLPLETGDLFRDWLFLHFPERAARVMSLIRQTRNGAIYQSRFGLRQRGSGLFAELLGDRFRLTRQRLGLGKAKIDLDTSQFQPKPSDPSPVKGRAQEAGSARSQLELF